MKERFLGNQVEVVANTPEQFAAIIKSDIAKWGKVIQGCRHQTRISAEQNSDRHPVCRSLGEAVVKIQHKLRHLAISVPDVAAAQKFFEEAFGMTKAGDARSGVHMTDGIMNVALLKLRTPITLGNSDEPYLRADTFRHVGGQSCGRGKTSGGRRCSPYARTSAGLTQHLLRGQVSQPARPGVRPHRERLERCRQARETRGIAALEFESAHGLHALFACRQQQAVICATQHERHSEPHIFFHELELVNAG